MGGAWGFNGMVRLLVLAGLVACCPAAGARVIRDIRYVERAGADPRLTSLDLHLPENKPAEPAPVMVLIHGGGWSAGDKGNRGLVAPKTGWLLARGFVVASVNYRLSPAVTHPAHIDDVCAAVAWLGKHAAEHGGDPRRLFLLGHSAGAHLAALAGIDRRRLAAAGADAGAIRGVILLDGAGYDVPRQVAAALLPRVRRMYLAAFTADAARQRDASPALKPIVDPPRFLLLHVAARADSRRQSEALGAALRAAGGAATVAAVAGKTHLTINRDLGRPGDPVTRAVAEFLGVRD